ncbi:MAG: lysylphosphatidylglycerol synthase domain-containing protein [Acidobacteriota bacterium]
MIDKRLAVRLLGALLLAASLVYLGIFAARHAAALPDIRWDARTGLALAGAVAVYGLTLLSSSMAWYLLLRSAGEKTKPGDAASVFLLSQVGKYLPGNIGQYVGRVALAKGRGLATGPVLVTLALEASCAVGAGLALTAAAYPLSLADRLGPGRLLAVLLIGILAIVLGARFKASDRLRIRAGLACLGLYSFNFLAFGGCAWLLASGALEAGTAPLPTLAAIFAAAWVAGFVTPGAPAGFGVREAVLVGGLRTLYDPGIALSLPLLFRLVTTLGDGLGFGAGALIRKLQKPQEPEEPQESNDTPHA